MTAVMRLLAIKFGIDAFFVISTRISPHSARSISSTLLLLAVYVVITYWLWKLAPRFGRRITGGQNIPIPADEQNLLNLYSFGFLLFGLYFALDSLPPSITWVHYILRNVPSEGKLSEQQEGYFYSLFGYLMKCILGFAMVLNGRMLASKLIKYQMKTANQPMEGDR